MKESALLTSNLLSMKTVMLPNQLSFRFTVYLHSLQEKAGGCKASYSQEIWISTVTSSSKQLRYRQFIFIRIERSLKHVQIPYRTSVSQPRLNTSPTVDQV